MLNLLDNLLRQILMNGVTSLRVQAPPPAAPLAVTEEQVRFQPPDANWQSYVDQLNVQSSPASALNVYLVDLQENRKLRSNERVRVPQNGVVYAEPAPARLDCHYLISAWSREQGIQSLEPTLDEHAILYEATAVLMQNAPINPSRVYPAGSQALARWGRFEDAELPTVVVPESGFPKLAEFWGTMGATHPWKPVLYLIVTIPVEMLRETAGPMVTTRITEYRQSHGSGDGEVLIQIAGHVLDAAANPPVPVGGAWVRLETPAGHPLQTTETNDRGRYTFERLQAGRYRLRWRAGARPEPAPRMIDVPSPTGEYDLRFT